MTNPPSESSQAALALLLAGAKALAHGNGPADRLGILVDALVGLTEAGSAAVLVLRSDSAGLVIAASVGVGDPAALEAAIANPGHPVARALTEPEPSFDVQPIGAGGPALRSHLPLGVDRRGQRVVLGVLALAHDRPIDLEVRPLVAAGADLIAVALELERETA